MNLNSEILSILSLPFLKLALGFIFSFIITFFGIPSVVRISELKGLYDLPGPITSHTRPTPRLGGAIIFAGVILSSVVFADVPGKYEFNSILGGMIVLFFIGLKDDIISLVPVKKAIGQLLASLILVVLGDFRLIIPDTMISNPVFSYLISIGISLFLVMTLINSINLIDGIDGLASGTGIVGSLTFGIWFIFLGDLSYAVICFALAGSLVSFFWFNVFSRKNKIFLGDTGAMLIGFLLAAFSIRFLNAASLVHDSEIMVSAPSIVLAVLALPVFDLIRIIIVRIYHGKSIFKGDNNHIHHRVLQLAGSHIKSTAIILSINTGLIVLTIIFRDLGNLILTGALVVIIGCLLAYLYLAREK